MVFKRVARFFRAQILSAGAVSGLLLISLRSGPLTLPYNQGFVSGDEGGPRLPRTEGPSFCTSKSVRNQADIRKVCMLLYLFQ
jgi:hypothetical protein